MPRKRPISTTDVSILCHGTTLLSKSIKNTSVARLLFITMTMHAVDYLDLIVHTHHPGAFMDSCLFLLWIDTALDRSHSFYSDVMSQFFNLLEERDWIHSVFLTTYLYTFTVYPLRPNWYCLFNCYSTHSVFVSLWFSCNIYKFFYVSQQVSQYDRVIGSILFQST